MTRAPASEADGASSDSPYYLSLAPNIHEFGRFADGGSDANWFVGFNSAWIVKLPPAPEGDWKRAFIGAKLGRAKTLPHPQRPWEHKIIPGKIYMAISQWPAFSSEQSFFLAETKDVPLQSHNSIHLPGAGHSEWFWKEIPLNLLSFDEQNYLIIWSPTRAFRDATKSPILAARKATGSSESAPRAWNNHSILGVPPRVDRGTLQVPISLQPALSIKLVPASGNEVKVTGFSTRAPENDLIVRFSVEGTDVELAWVEMSHDELEWRRVSSYLRSPPYIFTVPRSAIPPRGAHLRGKARDASAVEGVSNHTFVYGEGD
ncbi:hypothetical protein ACFL2T_01830 [Elusimicrobiota bacterium]